MRNSEGGGLIGFMKCPRPAKANGVDLKGRVLAQGESVHVNGINLGL